MSNDTTWSPDLSTTGVVLDNNQYSLTPSDQPYERHLMLDVECMGTRTNAPLAAIGAVIFEPDTGKILDKFYVKIDITTSVKAGAVLDPETIKWWLKQQPEAQLQLVGNVGDTDVYDVSTAITMLAEFVQRNQSSPRQGIKHWANGANFDPGIVEETCHNLGRRSPLVFWKSLCVRTLVEMGRQFGIDPKAEMASLGSPHKALDDCERQVAYVSQLWQRILPPHPRQYAFPPRNIR